MIPAFLTTLFAGAAKNITIVAVIVAAFLVSNGISGVYWYVKGHNEAAAKCRMNTVIQERDQLKRDKAISDQVAAETSKQLEDLKAREDARAAEEAENAANVKPIQGCVTDAPVKRVRGSGNRR